MNKGNKTRLPEPLKAGIENLSGISMDDDHVHVNPSESAQQHASAYTQGSEILLAPTQEEHVLHESWHVVQHQQGKVQPAIQKKCGETVNDDLMLEQEADRMGNKATGTNN